MLLGVTIAVGACAAVAGCSSSEEPLRGEPYASDAAPEVGDVPPGVVADAGIDVIVRTPEPFDGGPLPVVCAQEPCATALVTTFGRNLGDWGEGFCVLLRDETVACWGANGAGQLGRGADSLYDDPTAARVRGLEHIRQLDHTCGIDRDGSVWCWGTGPHLEGGSGKATTDRDPVKLPLEDVTTVGISPFVGCAVVHGDVVCWGRNAFGQLAPLLKADENALMAITPIELPPGAPVRSLVVSNAVFALREDGSVVSWGANPPLARVSSLFPDPYPASIALADVASITSSADSACAAVLGIGYCWGDVQERLYELIPDDAPRIDRALPEAVVAPEPLVRIDTTRPLVSRYYQASLDVIPQRWCGVGASGDVYCWGYNRNGQAGDGTKADVVGDPVKVQGLPGPATDVKTTPTATCALLTSGKVYCWGSNYYGQLGHTPHKKASLVPQEVALP